MLQEASQSKKQIAISAMVQSKNSGFTKITQGQSVKRQKTAIKFKNKTGPKTGKAKKEMLSGKWLENHVNVDEEKRKIDEHFAAVKKRAEEEINQMKQNMEEKNERIKKRNAALNSSPKRKSFDNNIYETPLKKALRKRN